MCRIQIALFISDDTRQHRNDVDHPEHYQSLTLVRLTELQLHRRYMILSIEQMNLEGIDGVVLTLRQCPSSQI